MAEQQNTIAEQQAVIEQLRSEAGVEAAEEFIEETGAELVEEPEESTEPNEVIEE